jgi:hypothetical protein
MVKTVRITFEIVWDAIQRAKVYRVLSISNSMEYIPGEYMYKEKVEMLMKIPNWDITIREEDSNA